MNKLAALTLVVFGFGTVASADEYDVNISKVDGTKVTFAKAMKKVKGEKAPKAASMTLSTADNVKVSQGKFAKKTKTYSTVSTLDNGLQNTIFSQKNVKAHITTNADNKITEILVLNKANKKKKKTT